MPALRGHEAFNKNGEGGRPCRYTSQEIDAFADELVVWMKNSTNVWFKDFCLDKDLDPDLLSVWATQSEKFSASYRLAKARQESRLVNGGLTELYNGSIVKFVLSNAHGWADKQESKVSGDVANPLAFILQNVDGATKELIHD